MVAGCHFTTVCSATDEITGIQPRNRLERVNGDMKSQTVLRGAPRIRRLQSARFRSDALMLDEDLYRRPAGACTVVRCSTHAISLLAVAYFIAWFRPPMQPMQPRHSANCCASCSPLPIRCCRDWRKEKNERVERLSVLR